MSASYATTRTSGACAECLRRSWLLSTLSGPLDCCARDRDRLQTLLALEDAELIEAIGGRRRSELRARYDAFPGQALGGSTDARAACRNVRRSIDVEALCHHDPRYPQALLSARGAPYMLNVLGGAERLSGLCSAPAVAILGSPRPSDYGRAVARGLARGLSVSGVSVICAWRDGIAIAALEGALEAGATAVAVVGDGLEAASPARRRALLSRLGRVGCAVSELPCDCNGRRWAKLASERTVVALATVAVVVEAEQTAGDLAAVDLARALGRTVAAVPGRVTSPLSRGTNALLRSGARAVIDAGDVLELLYEVDPSREPAGAPKRVRAPLEPRLRDLLRRVSAGSDTPDRLAREGVDLDDALLALSELELMGLVGRGDGGRYLPTHPAADASDISHV
ncbi:MAG TPA: DNA-processing protein DprA [Solirubrobacteraceae bacterium]|nr:DNA-processing protein DprA [Solirubrobacteraceae bacterium]